LVAICGALASVLALALGRWVAPLPGSQRARQLSVGVLLTLVTMVAITSGYGGLLVLLAASGIGLIPAAYGTRRVNCLGILLVPMLLDATGATPHVAHWLGL
jgi:putative membrane protein